MKKSIFFFFITLNLIISISCDDNVDPKTDLQDVYAINCVISGDTSFQIATITRSYDIYGYDPSTNDVDPFIKGAKIKLTYNGNGKTYTFRDTSVARPLGSKYSTPMNFYYLSGFKPESNSKISIEAVVPNGQVLKSNSTTHFLSTDFFEINSYLIPLPKTVFGSQLIFRWNRLERRNKIENIYFGPELVIKYFKIENGLKISYEKKVPWYYKGGLTDDYPKYPPLLKDVTEFSFDTLAIKKTIEELSAGDENKSNYLIDKAVFRLFAVDKDLATYYTSQKTFNEEFSVRVVQPNFSNILGGFGIFGTLSSAQVDIYLTPTYIKSFGYRAIEK